MSNIQQTKSKVDEQKLRHERGEDEERRESGAGDDDQQSDDNEDVDSSDESSESGESSAENCMETDGAVERNIAADVPTPETVEDSEFPGNGPTVDNESPAANVDNSDGALNVTERRRIEHNMEQRVTELEQTVRLLQGQIDNNTEHGMLYQFLRRPMRALDNAAAAAEGLSNTFAALQNFSSAVNADAPAEFFRVCNSTILIYLLFFRGLSQFLVSVRQILELCSDPFGLVIGLACFVAFAYQCDFLAAAALGLGVFAVGVFGLVFILSVIVYRKY